MAVRSARSRFWSSTKHSAVRTCSPSVIAAVTPTCLVEKNVNAVMADTMAETTALFNKRFGELTLDQIAPGHPVSASVHGKAYS